MAQSLGLGGCYIGAMRNHPAAVADELGLPDEAMVVFGMTIGYPHPAVDSDVKPRLPQNAILHRERDSPAVPDTLAEYDRRMQTFQAEQNKRLIDWTERAALRVKDEAALTGRPEGISCAARILIALTLPDDAGLRCVRVEGREEPTKDR